MSDISPISKTVGTTYQFNSEMVLDIVSHRGDWHLGIELLQSVNNEEELFKIIIAIDQILFQSTVTPFAMENSLCLLAVKALQMITRQDVLEEAIDVVKHPRLKWEAVLKIQKQSKLYEIVFSETEPMIRQAAIKNINDLGFLYNLLLLADDQVAVRNQIRSLTK